MAGHQALSQFKPPEIPKMPEAPKLPEAPKAPELPKAPEAPAIPEIPGAGGSEAVKRPKGPTRKVLDHKKQWVVLPRVGVIRTLRNLEDEGVDHIGLGLNAQVGIQQKFFGSVEAHVLWIRSGSHGGILGADDDGTIEVMDYSAGTYTAMAGGGIGMFTNFLDKNEIWSRVSLNLGYLHPFYIPVWIAADLEKEFRRTKGSYLTLSLSPIAGVLLPLRHALPRVTWSPSSIEVVDATSEEASPASSGFDISSVQFVLGLQLSGALIFGPRS